MTRRRGLGLVLLIGLGLGLGSFYFADRFAWAACTNTSFLGICKPAPGDGGWGTNWNNNADKIDNALGGTTAIVPKLAESTVAGLPTCNSSSKNQLRRITDNIRGIWTCDGIAWRSLTGHADVRDFATGGIGTSGDPWVGWEAPISTLSSSSNIDFVFPAGYFRCITMVTISGDRIHLRGARQGVTLIEYAPTASGTCFLVDKGSTVSYQGSISGLSFFSNDITTYTKTAIRLVDTSGWSITDTGTIYPHWMGNNSTFLKIEGRELGSIHNLYAQANRPIVIDTIKAPHTPAGISIDHFNFHNMYLIAVGHPVIEILTGVLLTQTSFTGYQAWVGGTDGLSWIDTTSTGVSNGLVLENIRWEQGENSAKYLVRIEHNSQLQGLQIRGGQGGGDDRNGFYLRKVANVLFDSFYYTSTVSEALNVDSTVKRIEGHNNFWQSGSTKTISGQRLILAAPLNPNAGALPPWFYYDESSNGDIKVPFNGAFTRIKAAGTTLVAGDIALSAGWGATATVSAISGTDQRFRFTVTSTGTGQGANPTATLTFKDGTWTTAPFATCARNGGNQSSVHPTWTTTATTLPLTFPGTPVAAETYSFECLVMG